MSIKLSIRLQDQLHGRKSNLRSKGRKNLKTRKEERLINDNGLLFHIVAPQRG